MIMQNDTSVPAASHNFSDVTLLYKAMDAHFESKGADSVHCKWQLRIVVDP